MFFCRKVAQLRTGSWDLDKTASNQKRLKDWSGHVLYNLICDKPHGKTKTRNKVILITITA